ncbi:tRNA (adenine22-N1)-methyltransferase [Proteiniborus ethanoligenes]|uniref:tRNA (Adenine22-N1)-methyltransferase n=1 Tax=Proteiniborus ethanoligenes TaxID=415015 RepID=A0A1H3R3U8_9FIRM|nr:class I SAM-dependent methyltransferase [Proteiniborus ethanoligenes]SDZ20276.1 tRNA (adenine22-N1)-methyltransferase [Proteiniborus ethanoligenes]
MKLSPRLQAIADYVQKGATVADIGTDHGYIPVYLVDNNVSNKIIATDINIGPLENAKSYIEKKSYEEIIETRLGNGLEPLSPNEVDTVIIAGMGGLLITEILESSQVVTQKINRFILQPMVGSEELRRYLYRSKYKIIDEKLAKEGHKIYEIIVAAHGEDNIDNEIYYEIGKKLVENKDKHLKELLEVKIRKTEKILIALKDKETVNGKLKYKQIERKYNEYKEVLDTIC